MLRMNTSQLIACGVLAGGIWVGLATRPDAQSVVTAFVGVSVIPMDKDGVLADQTVLIRDGKIAAVGPASKVPIPAGTTRVEGQGKFLMPGLAEMHAHIPAGQAPDSAVERTLFLYAANGITTIRGMLGDPRHLTYRARAARGEIVSPLIYTSGPSFNAKTASTKEMAVEAVIAQKKAG
jgi:cytosine/adenosine deaminase-related metal-dependent hydrolase